MAGRYVRGERIIALKVPLQKGLSQREHRSTKVSLHILGFLCFFVANTAMTILLRFIFGIILAGGLALWAHIPFPLDLVFVLSVGTMAAVWGDKFILVFMSLMRYFR
jgi:hypothetical protein